MNNHQSSKPSKDLLQRSVGARNTVGCCWLPVGSFVKSGANVCVCQKPEDEDEKNEEREERRNVVHRLQHDEQLVAKCRQKANQLQYPQQTKRPQNGQTARTTLQQLHQAAAHHLGLKKTRFLTQKIVFLGFRYKCRTQITTHKHKEK